MKKYLVLMTVLFNITSSFGVHEETEEPPFKRKYHTPELINSQVTHNFYRELFQEVTRQFHSIHEMIFNQPCTASTPALVQSFLTFIDNITRLSVPFENEDPELMEIVESCYKTCQQYRKTLDLLSYCDETENSHPRCEQQLNDKRDVFQLFYEQTIWLKTYPASTNFFEHKAAGNLGVLPKEIIFTIFHYLDFKSLYQTLPTCSKPLYFLFHCENFWKNYYLSENSINDGSARYLTYRIASNNILSDKIKFLEKRQRWLEAGHIAFNLFKSSGILKHKLLLGNWAYNNYTAYQNHLLLSMNGVSPPPDESHAQANIEEIVNTFKEYKLPEDENSFSLIKRYFLVNVMDETYPDIHFPAQPSSYYTYLKNLHAVTWLLSLRTRSLHTELTMEKAFWSNLMNRTLEEYNKIKSIPSTPTPSALLQSCLTFKTDQILVEIRDKGFIQDYSDLLAPLDDQTMTLSHLQALLEILAKKNAGLDLNALWLCHASWQAKFLEKIEKKYPGVKLDP